MRLEATLSLQQRREELGLNIGIRGHSILKRDDDDDDDDGDGYCYGSVVVDWFGLVWVGFVWVPVVRVGL